MEWVYLFVVLVSRFVPSLLSDNWTTLAAALLGGLIGSLSTLGATILQHQHHQKQERLQFNRKLNEARAERMRSAGEPLIHWAFSLDDIIIDQQIHTDAETTEERDARLRELLRSTTAATRPAITKLSLETDTDDIRDAVKDVGDAFRKHQMARRAKEERSEDNTGDSLTNLHTSLRNEVDELHRILREKIQRYETTGTYDGDLT